MPSLQLCRLLLCLHRSHNSLWTSLCDGSGAQNTASSQQSPRIRLTTAIKSCCVQIMGVGFMFRLEESSIASHIGERAPRGAADTESVAITEAGVRVLPMSMLLRPVS